MAIFAGTNRADSILRNSLSVGVTADPAVSGTAKDFSNVIYGYGGGDHIETGDGGDEVHGGAGNDRIYGSVGSDFLYGDAGSDLLVGGAGSFDILNGGKGVDRMFGGEGFDLYVVDSYLDVVFDDGNDPDDGGNYIETDLNYTLSEDCGVDNLALGDAFLEISAKSTTIYGGGNSHDNVIIGNKYNNILSGKDGSDTLQPLDGNDLVLGGKGDDDVQGGDGNDVVRGQGGDDYSIWGGNGADKLIGGRGDDFFFYNFAVESQASSRDIYCSGDGGAAFDSPGSAIGDIIYLPDYQDYDENGFVFFDFGFTWTFGGAGEGHVSLVNSGRDTLVRGNVDDDSAFEFQLLIKDGSTVHASDYTADDFIL